MKNDYPLSGEVRSLTSFRFLAAFYVFLFHIQIRVPVFGDGAIGDAIAEGAVGMSMFFVLSGFILSHAYRAVRIDFRNYMINRVARIYPVYVLAAALAAPWLASDFLNQLQAVSPIYAVLSIFIILIFGILLIQAWLPQTFGFWNNSASWSISAEAFFYALFPFLRERMRNIDNKRLIVLFVTLCILSTLVPASSIVFTESPASFSLFYALPAYRLPEFVAGIIAYQVMVRVELSDFLRRMLKGVVFCGVLHVFIVGPILPGFTLNNWIFIPAVCASLVLLFKSEAPASGGFMQSSIFVWLGRISYCFYSFQFHVLEGLKHFMPAQYAGGWLYLLVAFMLLVGISAAVHHLFEEPVRIWLRKRSKDRSSTSEVLE